MIGIKGENDAETIRKSGGAIRTSKDSKKKSVMKSILSKEKGEAARYSSLLMTKESQ